MLRRYNAPGEHHTPTGGIGMATLSGIYPALLPTQVEALIQRLEAAWGRELKLTVTEFARVLTVLFPELYAHRPGVARRVALASKVRVERDRQRQAMRGYSGRRPLSMREERTAKVRPDMVIAVARAE